MAKRRPGNGRGNGNGNYRAPRELKTFKLADEFEPVDEVARPEARARTVLPPPVATSEPAKGPGLGSQLRAAFGAFGDELKLLANPQRITGSASSAPLLIFVAIQILESLDRRGIALLQPEIKDYFGLNLQGVLTVTSVVGIASLLIALPIGFYADRINRVRMISAGAALQAIFSVFTGVAGSIRLLAVARLGSGIGQTLDAPRASLLADYYPRELRPALFSFARLADNLAGLIGPVTTGVIASAFFWQLPFFIYAVPGVGLAIYAALKLREPVRGEQERRALGASEEVALESEKPPSWTESWRLTMSVRTLRRILYAVPFLVGSTLVILNLTSLFYFQVFGLSATERGLLQSIEEPFTILGLIVGGVIGNRFLRARPGRIVTYIGLMSILAAAMIALMAAAPYLQLVVGLNMLRAFVSAVFYPSTAALLTFVIPPRVRGFALSAFALFTVGGFIILPFAGFIGDHFGLRVGIAVMAPVYLIGALIITSAGSSVDADIRQALAAAMAAHESRESKRLGHAKLLVVRDLDVHYGDVQILFNVDFDVEEGELVALLGTNGAGKSTLLRALSGLTPASNGAVFVDGEDITYLPPAEHAARGIVFMPGGRSLFPTLSVEENLRLAAWLYRKDENYVRESMDRVLEYFPILEERWSQAAANLSGGEQQMLALAQAFLSRPRLLMIDELSLGLAPAVVEQLLRIVRAIHELGTTIVLVEQSVNVALTVAKRAVFMEKGEIRFSGPTSDLWQRHDILRSIFLRGAGAFGGPVSGYGRKRGALDERETIFEVRDISKRFRNVAALSGVSFTLEEGRILGLIGPNGAGKTTLFDVVSGFVPADSGIVALYGDDITALGPDERARIGLQRSFQDARLFPSLTVKENIGVALEKHVAVRSAAAAALHLRGVRRSEATIDRRVERLIDLLNLGDFRDKFVRELSTGTRRIVDLACVMAADPKVVMLDEPSSGIAQAETEELGPLLLRVRYETGCSMLVIEHDMTLIRGVSDELIAMDLGSVVTRGLPEEVIEHPHVVASYLGTSEEVIKRSGM